MMMDSGGPLWGVTSPVTTLRTAEDSSRPARRRSYRSTLLDLEVGRVRCI